MPHGLHVVTDLLPVVPLFGADLLGIFLNRLIHLGSGAFDSTGGLGLFDDVHLDEAVHIWYDEGKAVQFADMAAGFGKEDMDLGRIPSPVVVNRGWIEAAVLELLLVGSGLEDLRSS